MGVDFDLKSTNKILKINELNKKLLPCSNLKKALFYRLNANNYDKVLHNSKMCVSLS